MPSFLRPLMVPLARAFGITPEEGAQTVLYLATSLEVEGVTGKYFYKCKERPSTEKSYDIALQQQLWAKSAEMTAIEH